MLNVCRTTGCPRPSCLSIISALALKILPPWDSRLFQVTKSGRFVSYIEKLEY